MQCRHCKNKVIHEKDHLCKDHFLNYYEKKAVDILCRIKYQDQKFIVGVSGGKDSAAVAHIMSKHCPYVELLYLDLGIPGYSDKSKIACEELAQSLGKKLHVIDFATEHVTIAQAKRQTECGKLNGVICGTCGLSKRYFLNKFAYEHGVTYVVTGHNLDDELAFVFMNLRNSDIQTLSRGGSVSKADPDHKLVAKIKPLYYLTEKDNRLYCLVNKLPIHNAECPYSANNVQNKWKEHLSALERDFDHFKYNTLKTVRKLVRSLDQTKLNDGVEVSNCPSCGYATAGTRRECRFCTVQKGLKKNIV